MYVLGFSSMLGGFIHKYLHEKADKILSFVRAFGHLNLHRSRLALEWFRGQVPLKGIRLIHLYFSCFTLRT